MITEIENMEAFKAAIAKPNCSVIDFYATWCGPCKMIHPRYEAFSNTYTNVSFYRVNVDNVEDVAAEVGINCMPTFKFYKNGAQINEILGANVGGLEKIIKENN
ncbi:thioredoxine 2 [Piromyces finnis]|uniref:Thioredoxin n=1 Tax=Piromyces finnis TaxID=1754191 RepID=A0A1Y1VKU0_9FUNG|nr:thioredoxine 2 [Piromyces finnis]|eukprot:ORX58369.1 thioredoxine 2 [Piromyces finnis]